jgi:phosphatidylserine decarboxylase
VTLPVTRYGLGLVGAVAGICIAATAAFAFAIGPYALLFLIPAAFTVFFFRDPERTPEETGPGAVLSPADGKVVGITSGKMPVSGAPAIIIDLFLSIFDVHMNRAPVGGKVVSITYKKGQFLNALRAAAADVNENNLIVLEMANGNRIAVRQISGVIARRIVCGVREGDIVAAGERIGMIKFGSRTQVFVPADTGFAAAVRLGQHVYAGKTVLGHMK